MSNNDNLVLMREACDVMGCQLVSATHFVQTSLDFLTSHLAEFTLEYEGDRQRTPWRVAVAWDETNPFGTMHDALAAAIVQFCADTQLNGH